MSEALKIARCSKCDTVMDLYARGPMPVSNVPPARAMAPLPDKFEMTDDGARLVVSWRWWSLIYIPLMFFAMFWDGFLLLWYGIAFATLLSGQGGGADIVMIVFPLLHVAAGVGLTYSVLMGIFNSTRIEAGGGRLSVRHGPLPWVGNMEMATSDIEQIYCQARRHRRKHGYYHRYEVHAIDRTGKQRVLLKGLELAEQALFLEQKLESFLGITDRPVAGEMGRRG